MGKIGIVLMNLGTPRQPNHFSVRRYLKEFLSDPYVIDIPKWWRWLLVNGIIIPFRTHRSTKAYRAIWTADGSPLLVNQYQLQASLSQVMGEKYHITLAMRYGEPSIKAAILQLKANQCAHVVLLPMFPQYSLAATETVIQAFFKVMRTYDYHPNIFTKKDFFDAPQYIMAQAEVCRQYLQGEKVDFFLFSYHGLPERQIEKQGCVIKRCMIKMSCPPMNQTNRLCYRAQCYATTNALALALNLPNDQYNTVFQSRLGLASWIKPYTDLEIKRLAKQNIKKIAIICPSFVSDCLETLEEIGIRLRRQWQSLGGETLHLIPSMNAKAVWVHAVVDMIKQIKLKESA